MEIYNVGVDELANYELECRDDFKFIVYQYENYGYEGDGEAVGLCLTDNMLYIKNLSHCSCYGPMDGGIESGDKMTIEDFLSEKEDVHAYDALKAIKDKVRELLVR